MRVVTALPRMQALARQWLREDIPVALVPTMGFLHEGHLSLMCRARKAVGRRGKTVVSIYVNPTQFGPAEDFKRYPRDLNRDLTLCRKAGVDVVFAPADDAMYPRQGRNGFSTYVVEERLSAGMEGKTRPTHFRGVTTVVTKLFHLVRPTVAVFGAKDWQQSAILKRMVSDLNFPIRLLVAPTVREADGLAMSSRNQYLTPEQRQQATVLWRSLQHARRRVQRGSVSASRLRAEIRKRVGAEPEARLDYVEFFDGDTLKPVSSVRRGTHLALAVFVGRTRLIDNGRL